MKEGPTHEKGDMMRRTWITVSIPRWMAMLLPLVGLLCGPPRAADSANTSCTAVNALPPGTCITYEYEAHKFVLCNGSYSLCSTANCQDEKNGNAACACDVVQSGLSLRMDNASQGAVSTLSNFSYAQFPLTPQPCTTARLVNCLDATCTLTPDQTKSLCTCPVTDPPGQSILFPSGAPVLCTTLRSGAPLPPPPPKKPVPLNAALAAAMNCVMQPPAGQ